jgi:NAD(P)-dependent dehydrogenase (short-subunit alcohol dehydrogenase family)
VAANDITPVNLDGTIAEILAGGGRARDYICDIAKRMPVGSLVDQVLADWGRIDILVNSARVAPRAALLEMDEWDWQRTLDVNLSGPFYTMQAAGRAMRAQGGGVIVNLALDLSQVDDMAQRSAYLASMNGLIGLTHAAARALSGYGVRVYAVCMGGCSAEPDLVLELGEAPGAQAVTAAVLRLCRAAPWPF